MDIVVYNFYGCLPHRSFEGCVSENWRYGSSESVYIDTELFENWFDKEFIPFCGTRRPALLTIDNHDSHISIDLIEKAKANSIHIIELPPHTNHLLQPLDVAILKPSVDLPASSDLKSKSVVKPCKMV